MKTFRRGRDFRKLIPGPISLPLTVDGILDCVHLAGDAKRAVTSGEFGRPF